MTMAAIQSGAFVAPSASSSYLESPDSLECNGDIGEEVAALEVENGETERTTAHEEREADEAAQAQADAAEVSEMHAEASNMRSEGIFDASTAVVGACLAFVCPPAASGAPSVGGLVSGHLSDGAGKLGDAWFHAAQHDDEANAALDKSAADQHGDAAKDAADAASAADAEITAALDFERNYTSTEAQTQLAALHRV
jgi:hypothetical protein